ncbi:HAD family phosphatase [Myxococcota bacterium]|nr:HAD family phosphatase [Myxococcota bacterium]
MLRGIDVVLFDNDGVLVDTEPLFLRATQELLATVGIELDGETYRRIVLDRGESVFVLAEARGISSDAIRALRQRRDARYAELIEAGVSVLSGVRETLAKLVGVRPAAIVTSSSRGHFDAIHRQTGLLRHFEFVLADGDYARQKPHPDPYLAAAKRFEVRPERCLVIEDTVRGLASARAAGMRCIAIPQALSRGGDFSGAEFVLGSMTELSAILGL